MGIKNELYVRFIVLTPSIFNFNLLNIENTLDLYNNIYNIAINPLFINDNTKTDNIEKFIKSKNLTDYNNSSYSIENFEYTNYLNNLCNNKHENNLLHINKIFVIANINELYHYNTEIDIRIGNIKSLAIIINNFKSKVEKSTEDKILEEQCINKYKNEIINIKEFIDNNIITKDYLNVFDKIKLYKSNIKDCKKYIEENNSKLII